jgi:hypothetical protein
MARGYEVMQMLRPNGGWIMNGEDYEGITFLECEPISKADFEAGFAQYDAWKAEQEVARAAQKQALLNRLGITEEEAKLLLGGN